MMNNIENKKASDNFSVALGLFDYINPIFYTITTFTIIRNMKTTMDKPLFVVFIIGAIISLIFGFSIPTVKFIVGLGKMKFKMPVNLVFYVNTGILISGIALFNSVFKVSTIIFGLFLGIIIGLLILIVYKTKKFNTAAVLTGAVGYILIYTSLITLSIRKAITIPIILYGLAIFLFVSLVLIGIKGNLKDARVHWVIEICNVICQGSVAIATILLFK